MNELVGEVVGVQFSRVENSWWEVGMVWCIPVVLNYRVIFNIIGSIVFSGSKIEQNFQNSLYTGGCVDWLIFLYVLPVLKSLINQLNRKMSDHLTKRLTDKPRLITFIFSWNIEFNVIYKRNDEKLFLRNLRMSKKKKKA